MVGQSYTRASPRQSASSGRGDPSVRGGFTSGSSGRGGFASAGSGRGGFASAGSSRGGFASAGSGRGGFASAGSGRGGFASAGSGRGDFASASSGRGGFASVASPSSQQAGFYPQSFRSLLQANGISGYVPSTFQMMGNPDWHLDSQNPQNPGYYPVRDEHFNSDINPEHEQGDEQGRKKEMEADNVSDVPSHAESTSMALQSMRKEKVWLRIDTYMLEPSATCASLITKSFENNFHSVMTWGALKIEQKDGYFDEFKKNCIWDENEEDIRIGWNIKAATKYSDFMHNMKKHIGYLKPKFLLKEAWTYLLDQWDDPKVKRRSAIMKTNRGRASPHTGGSRSFANTADFLRKEHVVTPHSLFVHTHTTKNDGKTYISSKALSVEKAFQVELAAQTKANEENGTPIDESKAYLIAAGGIKKSCLFGLGSQKIVQYGSSSSSSGRNQNGSSWNVQAKINQLNDTILTVKAEREAENLQRDQEMQVMQQKIAQMRAIVQGLTSATKRCAPQGSVDEDNHILDLD